MRLPNIIYRVARSLGVAQRPVFFEFPKEVDIGLTNVCNLNCSFCLNDKIQKKRGFMEETLFRSLTGCLADKFKLKTILGIGLFGEDTLHPKFADFLRYASGLGIKINISTNFVEVNEAISRAIIKSKINVVEISFYALGREQYNQQVRREKYDQVLKNIHLFLTMADKAGFNGEIRLRPFENSILQAERYRKEFYERYPNLNFGDKKSKTMANWAGFLNDQNMPEGAYILAPCSFPFSRMVADWDGEVRLCCDAMLAKDLAVGYVGEKRDLCDLWNSQELNKIREKFSKINYKDFPSCQNCYFARRYFNFRKKHN